MVGGWEVDKEFDSPQPGRHKSDMTTIALLYPGDRAARDAADPAASRFAALFSALAEAGLHAVPAVYHDDFADEVAAQLRGVDAVMVWHNPIEGERRRHRLDALLRELAAAGALVSTHPDVIERLGTKDVLFETRGLPFGSDCHRLDSLGQLHAELPARLAIGPRVLKQHRGHSGIGVWRVEQHGDALRVQHAQRGCAPETTDLAGLLGRVAPYFEPEAGGRMIDQPWQPVQHGMLRAYLVAERVAGFGHQALNALHPHDAPGPRLYFDADESAFQILRQKLEGGWVGQLREAVSLEAAALPLLWDCDFFMPDPAGPADAFVLCEINVSSVSPFPPSIVAPWVAALRERLAR